LTRNIVKWWDAFVLDVQVLDVQVLDDPAVASAALDPVRSRVLAQLREPGSATTVSRALGLPRQRVNYHLRTLEAHGLVRLVEERPRRGLTERVVVASATSYVVSPVALGEASTDPGRLRDRLSSSYLVALAARLVREVGEQARQAEAAGRRLTTLSLDTDIRFASAADRAAFTEDLAGAVTALVSRYHDESAPNGRWHRLVVASHPRPTATREVRP
jgi:DNA-binding transcriptional ArsR family regulator